MNANGISDDFITNYFRQTDPKQYSFEGLIALSEPQALPERALIEFTRYIMGVTNDYSVDTALLRVIHFNDLPLDLLLDLSVRDSDVDLCTPYTPQTLALQKLREMPNAHEL